MIRQERSIDRPTRGAKLVNTDEPPEQKMGMNLVRSVINALLCALGNVHACARTGRVTRLRDLLAKNPELLESTDGEGERPVHTAAKHGQVECLRLLAELGADVNAKTGQGVTPLHYASGYGEIGVVRYLLESGAEVDPQEETGMTPIMAAQGGGHLEIVDLLKGAGANADAAPAVADFGGGHFATLIAIDDPLMQLAMKRARLELPLLRQLFKTHPRDTSVKFAFLTDTGETEHLWGELLELQEETFKARVNTPPVTHKGKFEKAQQHPVSAIEDWQVEQRDGRIRGGFGYQVLFYRTKEKLGRLPEELAAHQGRFADHDIGGLLKQAKEGGG
jgi:uncharacterized protein YegJ (DUF2314 family)